eukprot:4155016-Amphidinium_carterae.1
MLGCRSCGYITFASCAHVPPRLAATPKLGRHHDATVALFSHGEATTELLAMILGPLVDATARWKDLRRPSSLLTCIPTPSLATQTTASMPARSKR